MRNKLLTTATLLLTSSLLFTSCKKDDDGNINQTTECGDNNGCILSQTIDTKRSITETYNNKGQVVKRVFLDSKFSYTTSFPYKENITDYFYDANDFLIKTVNVYYRLKHPTTFSDELYIDTITHIYTNDPSGRVVKDQLFQTFEQDNGYYISKSITNYKYNNKNQLILRTYYSQEESIENLENETVYTYDEWGRLIKKQDRGIHPKTLVSNGYYSAINPLNIVYTRYTYKYNQEGRLEYMRLDVHDPDIGSGPYDQVYEHKYYYNNCGDTTRQDYYYDQSNFRKGSSTTEYKLEYDDKGNLSRKTWEYEDIKYIYNCP